LVLLPEVALTAEWQQYYCSTQSRRGKNPSSLSTISHHRPVCPPLPSKGSQSTCNISIRPRQKKYNTYLLVAEAPPALVDALPVLVDALPVLVDALPVLIDALPVLINVLPVLVDALPVLVEVPPAPSQAALDAPPAPSEVVPLVLVDASAPSQAAPPILSQVGPLEFDASAVLLDAPPPFAVLVCLTTWNNPVKPMTTSRDFATATFCPSLWIDPYYPY
jgi:hypothetical protein